MSTTISTSTTPVTVTDNGSTVAVSVASSAVSVNVGTTGPQGATGPGVAAGGSTGQVLVKASGTNYDTAWTSSPTFGTATMTLGTATTLQAGTATLAAASIGAVSNAEIQYLDGLTEPLTTSLAGKLDSSTASTTYTALADLPYSVVVPAVVPVNASSVTATQEYFASCLFNCRAFAGTAQNNFMEWTFFVAAGTYTLRVMHRNVTNGGIASISIDGGADLGTTIDTYAAVNASNNITDITGIALTAGRHRVRFTAKTKNASSSDYTLVLHGFALTRTGA